MARRKKRKDYADKVSKKKAVKARFDDKFGNPIKKLDDLFLSLKPKKKKLGGFNVTNRFSKRMLPNKKRTTRIT
jgi:hypothetical protein